MSKLLLVCICLLALHSWTVVAARGRGNGGGGGGNNGGGGSNSNSGGSGGNSDSDDDGSSSRTRTPSMTYTETYTETYTPNETATQTETMTETITMSQSFTKTRPLATMTPNNASVKDPPTEFKTTNLNGVTVFLLHPRQFSWERPTTCAVAGRESSGSTQRTANAVGQPNNTVRITFGDVWPGNYVLCMKYPEDREFYEAPDITIELIGEILPANSMIKGCTGDFTAGTEVSNCYLETKDQQGNFTGSTTETEDIKIYVIDGDGEINEHTSDVTFEKRGKYTFSFTPQKAGDMGTIRAYVRGELVNNYLIPKYTVKATTAAAQPYTSRCHQEGTHTKCTVDKLDRFGNVADTCKADCN